LAINNSINDFKKTAYTYIKERILDCSFRPGATITEAMISEQLGGISRTPIREALIELQHEGYVIINPRKNIKVATLSFQELRDIYDSRFCIESRIVHRANKKALENHMPTLLNLNKQWTTYSETVENTDTYDYQIFLHDDLTFHKGICSISDNPILISFCVDLLNKSQRFSYLMSKCLSNRIQSVSVEHLKIINYLLDGKFENAAHEMEIHIINALETLNSLFTA
jgi:GntR family transcriptional regulator, rspAB operon transcriptional repressor